MKAVARQQKPAGPRAGGVRGGGRRHGDAHERQARHAGARFVHGGTHLAHGLTPAPASAMRVAGSRAEPLPVGVRSELESAFGVDLREIHLHRDMEAAIAAADMGARAFTSGCDIYFAAAQFDAASAGGRTLLAHEVAHAIQQAGRASSRGPAIARGVTGPGAPQRDDEVDAYTRSTKPDIDADLSRWSKITFDNLVDAHAEDAANADEFQKLYLEIASDLGLGTMETWGNADWTTIDQQTARAFVAKVPAYVKKYPGEFKGKRAGYGLIYDCLRRLKRFQDALGLLGQVSALRTATSHAGMLPLFNTEAGAKLFDEAAPSQSIVTAYLRDLPIRVLTMLLAPERGFQAHQLTHEGTSGTLYKVLNEARERAGESSQTGENELALLALLVVNDIDEPLKAPLKKPPTAAKAGPGVREAFAKGLVKYGQQLQQAAPESHGRIAASVRLKAGQAIEIAASRIVDLWGAALGGSIAGDEQIREVLRKDPAVTKLRASLALEARAFFRVGVQGELPNISTHASRATKFLGQLMQHVTGTIEPALVKVARTDAATLAESRAKGLAFVLRWLYEVGGTLNAYTVAEDQAFQGRWSRDDVRGAHRIFAARSMLAFAEFVDDDGLRKLAKDVIEGLDRPKVGNQLFLISDWQPDPDADWSQLGTDLAGPVRTQDGVRILSGPSITLLFQLRVLAKRGDLLAELLAADVSGGSEPLHRKVNRMLNEIQLPQRWMVRNFVYSARPPQLKEEAAKGLDVAKGTRVDQLSPAQREQIKGSDTEFPEGERPGELIVKHPKTAAQLAPWVPVADGWDAVVPNDQTESIFAWILPPIEGFTDLLRSIDAFNGAVVRVEELSTGKKPAEAWVAELSDGEWIEYLLRSLTEKLVPVEGQEEKRTVWSELEARTGISEATKEQYDIADKRYIRLLKEASGRQRQSIVAEQLAIITKDDSSLEARVVFARNTLVALEAYRIGAFPSVRTKDPTIAATIRIQLALAMLALAAAADKRIENAEDDRLIVGFTRLGADALEFLRKRDEWVKEAGAESLSDLLAPGDSEEKLLAGEGAVKALLDRLSAGRHQVQLRRGFRGQRKAGAEFSGLNAAKAVLKTVVPGTGYRSKDLAETITAGREKGEEFINGVTASWALDAGAEFTIDGDEYMLLEVHRPFVYFPSFAGPTSTVFRMEGHDPAFAPPIVLDGYADTVGADIEEKLKPLSDQTTPLVSVMYNGDVRTILPPRIAAPDNPYSTDELKDIHFLDRFAHAVTMESHVRAMEDSGDITKTFGELMTEVVAAMFGMSLVKSALDAAMVLQADELKDLVEQLQNDPVKFVRDVLAHLRDEFLTPENFIKVMLFPTTGAASTAFAAMERLGMPQATEPKAGASTKRKSPIGRVLRALVHLGRHVAGSLARLHKRVQGPVGAMRSRVTLHPALSKALSMVVVYGPIVIQVASALSKELEKLEGPEAADQKTELMEDAGLAVGGLKAGSEIISEEIDKVLGTLATLEIPSEIVPLVDLVATIGELVIKVLVRTGKARIADKLAGAAGVKASIYERTADVIKDTPVDPNWQWADKVVPLFAEQFESIRDQFVASLTEGLTNAAASFNEILPANLRESGVEIRISAKPTVAPEEMGGNYAEFVPYRDQRDETWRPVPLPADGEGCPLPGPLRHEHESRFQHDFGHVRLHTGAEARTATDSARALALTSGSNIWLHPNIAPTSTLGRHVLDHELAHVLQQTGPRPLGKEHPRAPIVRRGDRGVVVDPQNEEDAERITREVRRGRSAPVPVRGHDVEGYAPIVPSGVVFDFIGLLSNYRDTAKFQKEIDEKLTGKPPGKVEGLPIAKALWGEIRAALPKVGSYKSGTFRERRADIAAQVERSQAGIEKAIPFIAADTQTPDKTAMKEKAAADTKNRRPKSIVKTIYKLDSRSFVTLLAGYVFTKTGVATTITLDESDAKKPKVRDVQVHYLNLGKVALGDPLWKKLPFEDKGKPEMQVRMAALDPHPGVWDGSEYKLDAAFLTKYKRDADRRKKYGRPPTAQQTLSGVEGNTLSIATHGDLIKRQDNTTQRESHHTTQFLLVQYFSNTHKSVTAFPVPLPGLQKSGGAVTGFQATGRRLIQVDALYLGNRGEPMPAILLARETHRQGKLHIERGPMWSPEDGARDQNKSVTQAALIDSQFKSRLSSEGLVAVTDAKRFAKERPQLTDKKIQTGVYNAMTGTYSWMHQVMTAALRDALPRNELAYYHGWVARHEDLAKDKSYVLDPGQLDRKVVDKAIREDERIMRTHGWLK